MPKTATRARGKADTSAKPATAKAAKAKPPKVEPTKASRAKLKRVEAGPAPVTSPSNGPWSPRAAGGVMQGFGFGMPYPAVLFPCNFPATTPKARVQLTTRFNALLEGVPGLHRIEAFVDPVDGNDVKDTVTWFAALAARLPRLANLPVYAAPRIVAAGPGWASLMVPALSRGAKPTIDLLRLMCAAFARGMGEDNADLREHARAAFASLKASALTTSNTPRFVKAAVENGIVFQELPSSMVLYGIGRNSVLLDSSFTHECSNVGARIAKYKQLCTAYLGRAGLPVPANGIAQTEEQALSIARQLGYPVVVKPADKDGGMAVQADLRTEDEVRWAFAGAHKVSKSVLVEKFIAGRDYRIVVFRGKAIWAKERRPAGVTGDGKATIRQLVDGVNADPRRGSDVYAPLKKLVLDEEAEKLLSRDGLTFDSVPKKGAFVPLRRRANVSAGGTPLAVTDRMHPDNARVAERAAELVGLDLAGVDLIIPNIAQSWREVDSGICEINAQPELGGDAEHLYAEVLKGLVRNNGHVPTIAVLGAGKADEFTANLVEALAAQGLTVGSHDRKGVHVGGETIVPGDVSILRAGRMLTMDRRVDALVFGVIDAAVLRQGLPVGTIDALLLTGETPPEPELRGTGEPLRADVLRLMAPHCRNVATLAKPDEFPPQLRAAVAGAIKVNRVVPAAEHAAFLRSLVKGITAVARKANPG